MLKIALAGAAGKMGRAIREVLREEATTVLAGALEIAGHPEIGREIAPGITLRDNPEAAFGPSEVVIDFTSPEATLRHLTVCRQLDKGVVIGTTGFTGAELDRIKEEARRLPILLSPNMSLGVNLLFHLAAEAARLLNDYQAEITEIHHAQKVDAPSGTALKLAEIIAGARGKTLEELAVYGRQGKSGPRKPEEIGIHALRMGDVVGEHTVLFTGPGERVELVHRAASRRVFAAGAVRAAGLLAGKGPGLYSLLDLAGGEAGKNARENAK